MRAPCPRHAPASTCACVNQWNKAPSAFQSHPRAERPQRNNCYVNILQVAERQRFLPSSCSSQRTTGIQHAGRCWPLAGAFTHCFTNVQRPAPALRMRCMCKGPVCLAIPHDSHNKAEDRSDPRTPPARKEMTCSRIVLRVKRLPGGGPPSTCATPAGQRSLTPSSVFPPQVLQCSYYACHPCHCIPHHQCCLNPTSSFYCCPHS